jgi:hypothetical protein
MCPCILLDESVLRKSREMRLSLAKIDLSHGYHFYSQVNNKVVQLWSKNYDTFSFLFGFFNTWYIIKYILMNGTFGKQYVLWTTNCQCNFPRLSLFQHGHAVLGPQKIFLCTMGKYLIVLIYAIYREWNMDFKLVGSADCVNRKENKIPVVHALNTT